ncbi:MAG: hypothetical protein ACJAQT_005269 [Akkermansiaceae bacterium]|jgi:hypothetical protein
MFLGDRLGICFFGTRGEGSWGRSSDRGSGPTDRVAPVSAIQTTAPILRRGPAAHSPDHYQVGAGRRPSLWEFVFEFGVLSFARSRLTSTFAKKISEDMRGDAKQNRKITKLAIFRRAFFFVVLMFIATFILVVWKSSPTTYDLRDMPDGEAYTSTRFEFRYGPRVRVIDDPGNHLRYGYGDLPDEISVTGGTRLIVFNAQKAVIKSEEDSIDVHPDSVSHKGYMGVSSTNANYVIDSAGELQPK